MEALIKSRGVVKGKITSFKTYLAKTLATVSDPSTAVDDITALDIRERVYRAREAYEKFEQIQSSIEELTDKEQEAADYRANFEEEYFSVIVQAEALRLRNTTNMHTDASRPSAEISGASSTHMPVMRATNSQGAINAVPGIATQSIIYKPPGIRLPTIELPKFSGEASEWLAFRDTFESLIHKNETIDPIQKFHYLKAALQEGAAQIIKSLEFTAVNYTVAWETICNRFNNKRLLTHNHIKAIFNISSIKEESAAQIRETVDMLSKHLRALNALDQATEHWDALLIYLISTKLDSITARAWEKERAGNEIPTLNDFKTFLNSRADLLETLELNNKSVSKVESKAKQADRAKVKALLVQNQRCSMCKGAHKLSDCKRFLDLTPQERANHLRIAKLCLNCMRPGHFIKDCKASSCKQCSGKHNTLVHFEKASSAQVSPVEEAKTASVLCSHNQCNAHSVLLATASVVVTDNQGRGHKARAILDPGSQSSFITARLCKELGLQTSKIHMTIEAINGKSSQIEHRCSVRLAAQYNNFQFDIQCLVIPEITGQLPPQHIDIQGLQIPTNIRLADPSFHIPGNIDILIGADHFWSLLCIGQLKTGDGRLTMQKTKLGWIAVGPWRGAVSKSIKCNLSRAVDIDKSLTKFWEIEEIEGERAWSEEEKDCEKHFLENTYRNTDGRFVVSIPFKEDVSKLGESKSIACKRFLSLERKLTRNPVLKDQYVAFLVEYERLGHMCKVSEEATHNTSYYLPHHCVVKNDSSTTKVRVVFDASAATDNGISLNDLQMVGPTIQNDLLALLIRFRVHPYVILADVQKMYRQVLVNPDQRSLQRIIWRFNDKDPIQVFELNTLIYGTASAPFLATRCLKELANLIENRLPEIAGIIRKDFYVDDLLTGAQTIEQAIEIRQSISQVLESAGFPLRKWASNEHAIIHDVPKKDQNLDSVNFTNDGMTKTLGTTWQALSDSLTFTIKELGQPKVTKRQFLAETAQIFNPLGLISPCIITAKMLLQELWLHKLSWDESLPLDLHNKWLSFRQQVRKLDQIRVPRNVVSKNHIELQLHGFADASQKAYGACIYLRSQDSEGNIHTALLCAKSRVAPLKQQTTPRLELCAALTLARLVAKVFESLEVVFDKIVCWSDSSIVLSWLRMQPNALQVFVANRIAQIQQLTGSCEWRHVPTIENPADCLSRGLSVDKLMHSELWWHGPSFLVRDEIEWPTLVTTEVNVPDVKGTCCAVTERTAESSIFGNTSSAKRIIRVIAYCKRFLYNCKHKMERKVNALSAVEIREALKALVKIAQQECFPNQLQGNNKTDMIALVKKLNSLSPFIDSEGLLRVGGRLKNSEFSNDKRHPMVLLAKHRFTRLILIEEHIRLLHAAPQALLSSIREQFWIIGGRNLAKRVVHECVKCFRNRPQQAQATMGELPKSRVSVAQPFHATGVDYGGPFLIKDRKGRGCKTNKCYICLFICFATRAIHLELVSDLTTECFISALRRFVSRRGKPAHVYSDNGTNFVGANRELNELARFLLKEQTSLSECINDIGISWHFIPAYSPHFGGLWEAGIKSTKHHLKRVAGNSLLTFEEFYTLITQIEAVLNSRPLTPMSTDPNDLIPLTPAHFLIGKTLNSVADPDLTHLPESRLSRWQLIQNLQQHFWKRWSKEYLSELQQRTKWKRPFPQLKEGTMVLIKEENLPPFKWRLGRVISTHPGRDQVVRVATVKTSTGTVHITIAKLCPLPIESCT
ncbi:PREDICTED: uncharacterized protein LOC105453629 [Wasmannia auropunctata]|uniref:uncharacterized protein LOC105453629 n=1 Tax=Wasmannia auropunctata TaxID=64793 RepID=UPI0005EE7A07|nr:PREDICTED: uncharacterized protein LOC105453629 [Wasmannia auropunctata]